MASGRETALFQYADSDKYNQPIRLNKLGYKIMFSSVRKQINRFRERFSSLCEGRKGTVFSLSSGSSGLSLSWLTLENDGGTFDMAWEDILSIYVYKRDCWTVDLIYMAIGKNDETAIELNEEMNGWKELIERLPVFLPGCKPQEEWWQQVALPAFELNATEIYKRKCQPNKLITPNRGEPSLLERQ